MAFPTAPSVSLRAAVTSSATSAPRCAKSSLPRGKKSSPPPLVVIVSVFIFAGFFWVVDAIFGNAIHWLYTWLGAVQ